MPSADYPTLTGSPPDSGEEENTLFAHNDLHDGFDVGIGNTVFAVEFGIRKFEAVGLMTVLGIDHLYDIGSINLIVAVGITLQFILQELESGTASIAFLVELELGSIDDLLGVLVDKKGHDAEFLLVLDAVVASDVYRIGMLHGDVLGDGGRHTALDTLERLVGGYRDVVVDHVRDLRLSTCQIDEVVVLE